MFHTCSCIEAFQENQISTDQMTMADMQYLIPMGQYIQENKKQKGLMGPAPLTAQSAGSSCRRGIVL
jgi:hypothetical protein